MASSTENIFALMKLSESSLNVISVARESLSPELSNAINNLLELLNEFDFRHHQDKFNLNSQQNQIKELNYELQKKDELIDELQDNVVQLEEEKTRLEFLLAEEADKEKITFDPEFFEIFDDFEPIENSYQKTLEDLFRSKKTEIVGLKKIIEVKKSNIHTRDDKINRMRKEIRRLYAQKSVSVKQDLDQIVTKIEEPSINNWIDQDYYDYYADQDPADEQNYVDQYPADEQDYVDQD